MCKKYVVDLMFLLSEKARCFDNDGVKLCYRAAPIVALALLTSNLSAQAKPTASRGIAPTIFLMGTATGTGIGKSSNMEFPGGKNVGITGGLNVDFLARGPFRLGVEARGTYPIVLGKFANERSIVGGVRISYESGGVHTLRPYIDGQFGRGQINYPNGRLVGNLIYEQTATNLFGGGGGLEFDVTRQFSLKVDGQEHRWATPVVTGGSVWSGQVSIGVAYRVFAGAWPR